MGKLFFNVLNVVVYISFSGFEIIKLYAFVTHKCVTKAFFLYETRLVGIKLAWHTVKKEILIGFKTVNGYSIKTTRKDNS